VAAGPSGPEIDRVRGARPDQPWIVWGNTRAPTTSSDGPCRSETTPQDARSGVGRTGCCRQRQPLLFAHWHLIALTNNRPAGAR